MIAKKTRSIFFAVIMAMLFVVGAVVFPSVSVPADGPDSAHILVQYGGEGSNVRKIQFTAPITGLAALEQTGLDVVVKNYSWGKAVCSIGGVGCPADSCFSCDPAGRYWGYYDWDGSKWVAHSAGASSTTLNDGAVDGWFWGSWGNTPAGADPALAAQKALDWMRTRQVITDGGFGADSVTMDALIALGTNQEDPGAWSKTPASPSLSSYFLIDGQAIASKNGGKAGKLAVGLSATGLCYPYDSPTPMDYYQSSTGLYNPVTSNQAFAILGTVALSHTVPVSAVQALKNMQNSDGGWPWSSGNNSDSNTTALSVQALVAAGEPLTSTEIISGMAYIKSAQNTDGGFTYDPHSSWGTASDTNSTAYAINAIYAVGQDPITGTWAISGTNPVAFLLSMQLSSGAFEWQSGNGANLMATAQAIPALLGQHLPYTGKPIVWCPPKVFLPLIEKTK